MTRMPKVHEIVKSIFKKDPSRGVNPVSFRFLPPPTPPPLLPPFRVSRGFFGETQLTKKNSLSFFPLYSPPLPFKNDKK